MNGGWGFSYEIALRWMPLDLTDDKSTLVQAMAWCRQAPSHFLSQCWPRSMLPNGVTRPQWVKTQISWEGFKKKRLSNGLQVCCQAISWWRNQVTRISMSQRTHCSLYPTVWDILSSCFVLLKDPWPDLTWIIRETSDGTRQETVLTFSK